MNVVHIQAEGYNMEVKAPMISMKAGCDLMQYVDILIPCSAKFTLVKGKGPISLVGCHCVEYSNTEAEDNGAEDVESTGDTETAETSGKSPKSSANNESNGVKEV